MASLIDCPTENMNDLVSCLKVSERSHFHFFVIFSFISILHSHFFLNFHPWSNFLFPFLLYFIYLTHVPGRENPPGDCVGTQSVCGECSSSRSKNGQNYFEIKCFESFKSNIVIMISWLCSRNLRGRRLEWVSVDRLLVLRLCFCFYQHQVHQVIQTILTLSF